MKKSESDPRWIAKLRDLMESQGLNPRSLSLKAGLNPTAVRDMLEGRVKFPRYDTVEALANVLGVTPARLMSGREDNLQESAAPSVKNAQAAANLDDEDLNLLTEIIMRLQETAETYRHTLEPKDFAAMVTTIYRQIKPERKQGRKAALSALEPKIQSLMDYERLRGRRAAGRK